MTASVIELETGTLQGEEADGVHVFRGIPYAQPPVGPLRFKAPLPAKPWTGVRAATEFRPVSCQQPSPLEALFEAQRPEMSEDCLTLNVWTPGTDAGRRPVMVWIHGGAFVTGSGSTPWYDGASFSRTHDVVLVTINYRLGALGFLHLADVLGDEYAGSGNNGILDQVAALRWVRDNIALFGGDPGNLTIFGESAGGMSVGTLLATPSAKGLFHRAIPQSGAANNALPREQAVANTRLLLDKLGIDPASLIDVPVEQLLEAQGQVVQESWESGMAFQPVVDGTALPERPIDGLRGGASADVAVLTGTNLDEMRLFTVMDPSLASIDEAALQRRVARILGSPDAAGPTIEAYRAARPDATLTDLWAAIESDHIFRIPAIRMAEARGAAGAPTFEYLFTWPTSAFGGQLKSCHALEIPFVFNALDAPGAKFFTGEASAEMRTLATTMHEAWASFARTGQPKASGLPDWPAYRAADRATMIFDVEPRIEHDPAGAERQLWDGVL